MADNSESLKHEIDDELKLDQYKMLWQRYKLLIIAGVAIIIIGVSIWQYVRFTQAELAEQRALEFGALWVQNYQSQDKDIASIEAFIAANNDGYSDIMRLLIQAPTPFTYRDILGDLAFNVGDNAIADNSSAIFTLLRINNLLKQGQINEAKELTETLRQDNSAISTIAEELLASFE